MATITATLTAGTAVQLTGGNHTWRADEPRDVGGTDTGPTPYELLLSALAACTCMTVSLYAARRGIAMASVSARFSYDRSHRRDCEECAEERSAFIDRITAEIVIAAEADDQQRRRLADVAARCPVRRTLQGDTVFSDVVRFETSPGTESVGRDEQR